jgi:hypothetical protein
LRLKAQLKKQGSTTGDHLQHRMDTVLRENDSIKLELEVSMLFFSETVFLSDEPDF